MLVLADRGQHVYNGPAQMSGPEALEPQNQLAASENPMEKGENEKRSTRPQKSGWNTWIHGKQLVLTLVAIVGGALGLFQWGHMIGEAGLKESNALHQRQLEAAIQAVADEKKGLQSEVLVYQ